MIIKREEKFIRFKLEDKEWKIKKGDVAREFISKMKPFISEPWDPETKFWTIDQKHEAILFEIKDECFTDKKQANLF